MQLSPELGPGRVDDMPLFFLSPVGSERSGPEKSSGLEDSSNMWLLSFMWIVRPRDMLKMLSGTGDCRCPTVTEVTVGYMAMTRRVRRAHIALRVQVHGYLPLG